MSNRPKKWIIVEKAEASHYLFAASPLLSMTKDMESVGFSNIGFGVVEYIKEKASYIFPRKIWADAGDKYLKIILNDPKLIKKIFFISEKFSQKLFEYGRYLLSVNLKDKGNEELGSLYEKFEELHNQAHFRRTIFWVMETPKEIFSKYVINLLKEKIKQQKLKLQPEVVFAILATPLIKNHVAQEEQEFIKTVLKLKDLDNINDGILNKKLEKHYKKYCWLPYGMSGPAWDKRYFVKNAKKYLIKDKAEIIERLRFLENQVNHIKKQQEKFLKLLKLDKDIMELINIARKSIYIKSLSKEALFYGFYASENLIKEIGNRLGINVALVRRMLPWEIKTALKLSKVDAEELKQRYKYSVQYAYRGKTKVFIEKEAKNFIKSIDVEIEKGIDRKIIQLIGVCAQPGKAIGNVKIINNAKDLNKMKNGDILISKMTDPEIIAAMKKAGAVVTDMGGITCHAAIVSRELGIPCIIGTKYATKIFEDNNKVEVDADKGIIKKI